MRVSLTRNHHVFPSRVTPHCHRLQHRRHSPCCPPQIATRIQEFRDLRAGKVDRWHVVSQHLSWCRISTAINLPFTVCKDRQERQGQQSVNPTLTGGRLTKSSQYAEIKVLVGCNLVSKCSRFARAELIRDGLRSSSLAHHNSERCSNVNFSFDSRNQLHRETQVFWCKSFSY